MINNGHVSKKRDEKKQKDGRKYKKFTIDEHQLIEYSYSAVYEKSKVKE